MSNHYRYFIVDDDDTLPAYCRPNDLADAPSNNFPDVGTKKQYLIKTDTTDSVVGTDLEGKLPYSQNRLLDLKRDDPEWQETYP